MTWLLFASHTGHTLFQRGRTLTVMITVTVTVTLTLTLEPPPVGHAATLGPELVRRHLYLRHIAAKLFGNPGCDGATV